MVQRKLLLASSVEELKRCFPVMKELRTALHLEDFLGIYDAAHSKDNYEIVALEENGEILAVMGYRILYDFVHGKHIYIDDLVTTSSSRSQGLGKDLLQYAETKAIELACKGLRLCTGIENELGKKFYEANGWKLRALAYKKKLQT